MLQIGRDGTGSLRNLNNSEMQMLTKPHHQSKPEGGKPKAPGAGPSALPDFILKRNKLFDDLKRKRDAEILEKEKPTINVVLDLGLGSDGKPRPTMPVAAKAWESTPGSFLRHVDKDISSDVVIAKIDGKELWDLDRPLEYACTVSYLPFSSAEGRKVFWHSSAHVLGESAECHYQCLLSHGPPVDQGFFYDMALPEGYVCQSDIARERRLTFARQSVDQSDWKPLEDQSAKFFKEKQPFERLHVSIPDLKEMFGYSKYKMYYIENLLPPEGSSVYKCGTLVDLCLGPHIQNTAKIKAFKVMKVLRPLNVVEWLAEMSPRTHPAISVETRTMIHCKEFTESLFLTKRG